MCLIQALRDGGVDHDYEPVFVVSIQSNSDDCGVFLQSVEGKTVDGDN